MYWHTCANAPCLCDPAATCSHAAGKTGDQKIHRSALLASQFIDKTRKLCSNCVEVSRKVAPPGADLPRVNP